MRYEVSVRHFLGINFDQEFALVYHWRTVENFLQDLIISSSVDPLF